MLNLEEFIQQALDPRELKRGIAVKLHLQPTFSRLFRTKNNICGRTNQETAKLDSVYRKV